MSNKITSFDLRKNRIIGKRYIILGRLGKGQEGEVYKAKEVFTGALRAIKLFFPHRNPDYKMSVRYARKLDKLSNCHIIPTFHSHEIFKINDVKIACLVSEYIDGEILFEFVNRKRGKKLDTFQAMGLLHSLAKGVEMIHLNGEYHGDLHVDNIIVKRFGVGFEIKIIDLYHWGDSKKANRDEDIIKMIKIFHEILGGRSAYKKLAPSLKDIICGLKRKFILQKYKDASSLIAHLENMDWSNA